MRARTVLRPDPFESVGHTVPPGVVDMDGEDTMARTITIALGLALSAGCALAPPMAPDSGSAHIEGRRCPGFVVDGRFGSMDDPECAEWQVEPIRGRFGDLYVAVDAESNLVVLNDWHLREDAPAEPGMYNLFCLATDLGLFEIRVFGDQHIEAWLDGEAIHDQVQGASGFGPSPLTPTPHSIFEFVLATLPSEVRLLECDPAGGTVEIPALPPDVTIASEGTCFPGSAPAMPHNLVREPTIFELELGPDGVRRATATRAPSLFGTDARTVAAGGELVVYGAQLGASGTVRFDDLVVDPIEWSDSRVRVRVPAGLEGPVELAVSVAGVASNALPVSVHAAGCTPTCGECGDDGCGGSCGACNPGYECDASRTCVPQVVD